MNGHLDHVAAHQAVASALTSGAHRPEALYYFAGTEQFTEPGRPGFLDPTEVDRATLPATTDIDTRIVLTAKLRSPRHAETGVDDGAADLIGGPHECLTGVPAPDTV